VEGVPRRRDNWVTPEWEVPEGYANLHFPPHEAFESNNVGEGSFAYIALGSDASRRDIQVCMRV
jgi:hypothetical protein